MLNFGFKRRNNTLPRANLVANIPNRYPFTDRIGKHDGPAQLRQYAQVASGTITFYHPAITGSETITSSGGDATVSVVVGGIVVGVGKKWSIKDNAGHHWSHCSALSPTSAVFWDVSWLGTHLVATGLAEAVVAALCSSGRDLTVGTDWLDRGFTVAGDVYQVARLSNGSRKLPDDMIVPALEDSTASAGYIFTGELFPENAILHYDADVEPLTELTGGVHTLNYAILSPQYQRNADGGYTNVGEHPAVDVFADGFKGLRSCGAITNLLPGDTSVARSVTLTAQAYTLQIIGAGLASCSYGTATVGEPLTFTATAGITTFTPAGATLWILTATSYPTHYVPPGVTQPVSYGGVSGGSWFSIVDDSPVRRAFDGETGSYYSLTVSVNGYFDAVSGETLVQTAGTKTTEWLPCNGLSSIVIDYTSVYATCNRCRIQTKTSGGVITYFDTGIFTTTSTKVKFYIPPGAVSFRVYYSSLSASVATLPIMRIISQPLTLATRVRMAIGSADLPNSSVLNICTPDDVSNRFLTVQKSAAGALTVNLNDGTNNATVTLATWDRGETLDFYPQVVTSASQMRVGYKAITDASITWGSATTYDGSFNPDATLFRLMIGYGNIYPVSINKLTVWPTQVPDAELLEAWT